MAYTEDHLKMLEAIRRFPDDLSLRLAYADYLDGLDTRYVEEECPACRGRKTGEVSRVTGMWLKCETCQGTGLLEVRDASIAARAELIRVQVELAQHTKNACYYDGAVTHRIDPKSYASCGNCTPCVLRDRERELINEHTAAWRRGPVCTQCEGTLEVGVSQSWGTGGTVACPHCRGCGYSGHLARYERGAHWHAGADLQSRDPEHKTLWSSRVEYVYGMKRVVVPQLSTCMKAVSLDGPSVAMCEILAAHPDAIEIRPKDKEPMRDWSRSPLLSGNEGYDWRRADGAGPANPERIIPSAIFDLMVGMAPDRVSEIDSRNYLESPSVEDAKTILGRAVARFGRHGGP